MISFWDRSDDPGTPSAGHLRVYIKDGDLYSKDSAGVVRLLTSVGSNGFTVQATAPSDPNTGDVWLDSDTGVMSTYNGATWDVSFTCEIPFRSVNKQDTGWAPNSIYDATNNPTGVWTESYDYTTRKITLTNMSASPAYLYWQSAVVLEVAAGATYVSEAHDATNGGWFWYYNGSAFVWSQTAWTFDLAMIGYVYYTGSATSFGIVELHGLQDWHSHEEDHDVIGTYKKAGGAITGYTLSSTTAANRRPDIGYTAAKDEDVVTYLPALTEAAGAYTRAYIAASSVFTFVDASDDIVPLNGNIPQWNNVSTGALTDFTNNQYGACWLYAIPVMSDENSQKRRYVWVAPQSASTTLATIQALTPGNLTLGTLSSLSTEWVPIARVIVHYSGGNWTFTQVDLLSFTKQGVTPTTATGLTAVTTDATLTGDGNVGNALGLNLANANTWTANQLFQRLAPRTDNAYDLGISGTNRWRDLYLSGDVYGDGWQITNGGDTEINSTTGGILLEISGTNWAYLNSAGSGWYYGNAAAAGQIASGAGIITITPKAGGSIQLYAETGSADKLYIDSQGIKPFGYASSIDTTKLISLDANGALQVGSLAASSMTWSTLQSFFPANANSRTYAIATGNFDTGSDAQTSIALYTNYSGTNQLSAIYSSKRSGGAGTNIGLEVLGSNGVTRYKAELQYDGALYLDTFAGGTGANLLYKYTDGKVYAFGNPASVESFLSVTSAGVFAWKAVSDYATTSALAGYLPLTGGSITGNLTIGDASADTLTINATPTLAANTLTFSSATTTISGGLSFSSTCTFTNTPRISMTEPYLRLKDSDAATGSATSGYIQWLNSADSEVAYFGRKDAGTAGVHRWYNGAGDIEIEAAGNDVTIKGASCTTTIEGNLTVNGTTITLGNASTDKVRLNAVATGTIVAGGNLGLDSNGDIVKASVSGTSKKVYTACFFKSGSITNNVTIPLSGASGAATPVGFVMPVAGTIKEICATSSLTNAGGSVDVTINFEKFTSGSQYSVGAGTACGTATGTYAAGALYNETFSTTSPGSSASIAAGSYVVPYVTITGTPNITDLAVDIRIEED